MAMANVARQRVRAKTPTGKTKKLKGSWRTKKPKTFGKARVARVQTENRYGHVVEDGHRVVTGGSNLLCSDRINDKEQFVDAFLFLKGIEVDSEQAKKLKQEKILIGIEDSDARYLSKVMTESDIKILRDDLKDDIHRFSMVPDLSDESFGNNLSGVAIKYKLLGFEQAVKNKERFFTRTLRKRFEMYNQFLALKSVMAVVPSHRVDIVYNYNLPANELEISQMIANLQDVVSSETLLSRLPFITDSKEEAELKRAEQAEKQKRTIEETQQLAERGY